MMKINCPCCGYLTIEEEWDVCPVCYWECVDVMPNEFWQQLADGANGGISLDEAKKNYLSFGACDEHMVEYVRKPYIEEMTKEDVEKAFKDTMRKEARSIRKDIP